ncbi:TnsD family Tn7-like transposition protein [Cohnella lubricantis]|uniref:TniQ family protein n=1 Tax=Cohnella lubricantis TaxID=2163172 RepID=A0A841TI44_9BACL|nr:TnsD family Tn7-like transposition protein [Cohnella lubricantis]MBB6678141.1 TniQ family protein [Cohnella lubricantis]MBP2120647.1 hypothetical protein [Cohnella lubricantis]
MIYFPSLFPDEILYSAFARYHRDSGNENYKLTMEELFGNTSVCASLLFPSHLTSLCDRMPPGNLYSPEDLINNHTFLPYYTPFIPEKRYFDMKEIMKSSKGTSAYMQIGKPASTVKTQQGLRYCPACVIRDREIYGEAYWHRSHQAEGVFVCHYHPNTLITTNVTLTKQRNKHEFVSLEVTLRNEDLQYNPASPQSFSILKFIAEQTNLLLSSGWNPLGLLKLNQFYVSKLQNMGFANHTGRIRWSDLIPAFNRFFGKQLLIELQSHNEPSLEATWLHKLLRKPRVTCHPLRHLLVLGFLGETIESMTNQISEYKISYEPFGKGPWPCLNKAADHYKAPMISSCEITRCSKTGLPVGTFSCTCGFVYSRKGPDQSIDDRLKIGRIKNFGEVWYEKLRIISQQDISLREMSRRLGCDPKTVINRLSNSKTPIPTAVDQESISYKKEWRELVSSNSELSVTELRKLNQSVYAWLYRHDRSWLHEHSPVNRKSSTKRERINWAERDHQIAKEVQLAANEILHGKSDKLIRVTKTEIGRRIGKLPLLFNMLHKLPETAKQLNVVLETVEEFQKRRINHKAVQLKNTNAIVKRWELIKVSGLREKFIESHHDVISDLSET